MVNCSSILAVAPLYIGVAPVFGGEELAVQALRTDGCIFCCQLSCPSVVAVVDSPRFLIGVKRGP